MKDGPRADSVGVGATGWGGMVSLGMIARRTKIEFMTRGGKTRGQILRNDRQKEKELSPSLD